MNVEALDGLISLLEPSEPSCVLLHRPNEKWSFDVYVTSRKPIDKAYEECQALGGGNNTTPKIFYTAVCTKDLDEYIKLNGYTLMGSNQRITMDEPKPLRLNIIPITLPEKEELDYAPGTRLVRDNEPLIYKYKSPNQQ
jgi:hypothetical protein